MPWLRQSFRFSGTFDRRGGVQGGKSLASSMVEVDELIRLGNVADDVEFADGLLLRGLERRFRRRKTPAVARIFRPLSLPGQIFEGVLVFDEYVHGRAA